MAVEKSRVGDEPLFKVRIMEDGSAVDVSGAGTKEIKIQDPDGNTVSKTASFTSDGTDGWIEYQTTSGDIDAAGDWYYAGRVIDGAGRPFETVKQRHIVQAAL